MFSRWLFLCLPLCLSPILWAHNVVSTVYAEGMLIEGEVGFSNGDMALEGTLVEVFDGQGNKLGETQIQDQGLFQYTARELQNHVFRVNLSAGHVAEMHLEQSELSGPVGAADTTPSSAEAPPATPPPAMSLPPEVLAQVVREAVAKQIKPLRKELLAMKEKIWLRDILGGLGFILGLCGCAAWFSARRLETQSRKS